MHYQDAPDAVIVVDMLGTIIDANDLASLMFGYTEQEFLGKSIDILVPKNTRTKHRDLRIKYLQNPTDRELAMVDGLRKDGTTFKCEITLSPSMDNSYIVATVHDTTQREVAKECMQKLSATLKNLAEMVE